MGVVGMLDSRSGLGSVVVEGGVPMVAADDDDGSAEPRADGAGMKINPRVHTMLMEQLQRGYIQSVAATAGCTVETVGTDAFGMDAFLIRPPQRAPDEEVMFLAQFKCTSQFVPDPTKESFGYQFTKRAYFDKLVTRRRDLKSILIVMTVPKDQSQWTEASHEGLLTRRTNYWVHLEGLVVDPQIQRPTVRIPTANVFDSESLIKLMDRVDRGESLNG
ncbi:DUF4365 domain-containing protein [Embleya sp. NPDC059259]|uniref:DUF4365 domain-containing protein n=1 Tax=unclassified Embleya TaxID=2699296 RepID=UPI0036A850DD